MLPNEVLRECNYISQHTKLSIKYMNKLAAVLNGKEIVVPPTAEIPINNFVGKSIKLSNCHYTDKGIAASIRLPYVRAISSPGKKCVPCLGYVEGSGMILEITLNKNWFKR